MSAKKFQVFDPEVSAAAGDVRVTLMGRHEIHYVVSARVLIFGREPLFEGEDAVAYEVSLPRDWRWEPPHDTEMIAPDLRTAILADVRAALAELGRRAVFPGEPF